MSSSSNCLSAAFSLCLGLSFSASAQQQMQAPLDDQRIMQLVQAGVHADELQRMIASAPQVNFLMNPASTDVMLTAGVSEDVIKAMAARQNGLSTFTAQPTNRTKPMIHPHEQQSMTLAAGRELTCAIGYDVFRVAP